eukprot:2231473-Rhodomonas_salina.2
MSGTNGIGVVYFGFWFRGAALTCLLKLFFCFCYLVPARPVLSVPDIALQTRGTMQRMSMSVPDIAQRMRSTVRGCGTAAVASACSSIHNVSAGHRLADW